MATGTTSPDVDDDLYSIATEQRRELMAAQALDADLDLAFDLQMQEAINASLSLQPSSSSSAPAPPSPPRPPLQSDDVFNLSTLQTEELDKFERERNDRLITEAERKKAMEDIRRQIHDRRVALEIDRMPDDEWEDFGDEFERPFVEDEGSSSEEIFRVYFKGLVVVGDERRDSKSVAVAGIGVAICDSRDDLVFELSKPLIGSDRSRQVFEMKALIEGLNAAIALDLKRVVFFCDFYPLYQFVTGRWLPKQRKIVSLISQVNLLRGKFNYSAPFLVARNDVKFAIKLAREAVDAQISRVPEPTGAKNMYETCVICLEDMDTKQIFSVDGCSHRYCLSCMRQHVEVKLLHGMVPKCPYEGCNSELKIDSCRTFLTPKLIEIMSQRIREASIPSTDKVYCPYPKCSVLMSKIEVLDYSAKASVEKFSMSSISERFMGMRSTIITNNSSLKSFGGKLGFTMLQLSEIIDNNHPSGELSLDTMASELLKLLGFQEGKTSEKNPYDLVFFHIGDGGSNGQKDSEYINGLVGQIMHIAEPGSEIGSRLHLSLVMSYGPVSGNDDQNFSVICKDKINSHLLSLFPRQSYTAKGSSLRSNVRHCCPMLVAQWQNAVTRKDMAEAFSFKDFKERGGILTIPADRFIHEIAFKLWKAPKYGA